MEIALQGSTSEYCSLALENLPTMSNVLRKKKTTKTGLDVKLIHLMVTSAYKTGEEMTDATHSFIFLGYKVRDEAGRFGALGSSSSSVRFSGSAGSSVALPCGTVRFCRTCGIISHACPIDLNHTERQAFVQCFL